MFYGALRQHRAVAVLMYKGSMGPHCGYSVIRHFFVIVADEVGGLAPIRDWAPFRGTVKGA
jgi:hypothetical protein